MKNRIRILPLLVACLAAIADADEQKAAKPSATSMLGTVAGQVRDDNGLKMKLVWCPPGIIALKAKNVIVLDASNGFAMFNRPAVATQRAVISRGYWIARCETTQREWKQLMSSEPWKGDDQRAIKEGDGFPACCVNWNDALDFCAGLTKQERDAGRLDTEWEYSLPTEAQWEHACRAHSETQFCFGDDMAVLAEYAWIGRDGLGANACAHEVGQKKPNAWGLFDTHGNLFEWTREPATGLVRALGPEETAHIAGTQVIRGGGWNALPEFCASSQRVLANAERRSTAIGFRVALTPVRPAADTPAK